MTYQRSLLATLLVLTLGSPLRAQEVDTGVSVVELEEISLFVARPAGGYFGGAEFEPAPFVTSPYTVADSSGGFFHSTAFKISVVPVSLMVTGLLLEPVKEDFRDFYRRYWPDFSDDFDDFAQYVPLLGMYGLDLFGVKGKHSVWRATVSAAMSGAIVALTVNPLKAWTNSTRPDGSANNSFPSGHTATAFMSATVFHKEYGERKGFPSRPAPKPWSCSVSSVRSHG